MASKMEYWKVKEGLWSLRWT